MGLGFDDFDLWWLILFNTEDYWTKYKIMNNLHAGEDAKGDVQIKKG